MAVVGGSIGDDSFRYHWVTEQGYVSKIRRQEFSRNHSILLSSVPFPHFVVLLP